eukprot:gene14629-biopygen6593
MELAAIDGDWWGGTVAERHWVTGAPWTRPAGPRGSALDRMVARYCIQGALLTAAEVGASALSGGTSLCASCRGAPLAYVAPKE